MKKRTAAAALASASIGVLWRFRQDCGVDLWAAVAGSICLAGMALALALVPAEGGHRPRGILGALALAAGIGAAIAASTIGVPESSRDEGGVESPPAVLCELLLDDSRESRALLKGALDRKKESVGRLIVVAYLSGGFLRQGLLEFTPPLKAPAAIIDYVPVGPRRDLASVLERALTRDRLSASISLDRGGKNGLPSWTTSIRNPRPGKTSSLEFFILQLKTELVLGREIPVALSQSGSGRLDVGPGDETRVPSRELFSGGGNFQGDALLLVLAGERVEFAAILPLR